MTRFVVGWTFAGLDSLGINKLISYGDSTFVSTSNSFFILRRQAYGTSGVTKVETRPVTYALFQNYPNPFNPTTVISYQLPTTGKVSLKIYDLLGREVETLGNGQMEAGLHQVSFDASNLAIGIYFYRIEAGKFTATKKLVLLK
jgi:hypothetical protein